LLYLLACAVEHAGNGNGVPFIIDFLPHLVVNDTAPNDTILQFKDRWAPTMPFLDILGDAAFGSLEMLNDLKTQQVKKKFLLNIFNNLKYNR
jgi:hypothetical protein